MWDELETGPGAWEGSGLGRPGGRGGVGGAGVGCISEGGRVVTEALEAALVSPSLPPAIQSQLLNLAEFMELQDKMLPLDIGLLASKAESAHALAKFLHY
ncbi:unnamed protein product, partial [Discosporangium mesarthrocarpum]